MTNLRDPDALLSAYLADGMEVLPDRVVDSVLDEVHRTRQQNVFGPRRTRVMSRTTFAAAAVVAAVALGGAFVVIGVGPSPTPTGPSPSLPGVVPPSLTSSDPGPSSVPPASPEILSLDLAWTEVDIKPGLGDVAWLGGRFVLVDSSGAVRTSIDGLAWDVLEPGAPDPGYADLLKQWASLVTWEDQIVGWWNPESGPEIAGAPPITARDVLRIVRPPAEPIVATPFEGRIESIGIGPVGIVVQTNIGTDGFSEGAVWFSPDGIDWTVSAAGFRTTLGGLRNVVGVSDGFIGRDGIDDELCTLPDGCSDMWHSADGLTWRNLGHPDAGDESGEGRLVPWQGGALTTDGIGRFDFWTSKGRTELPMAAEVPAQPQSFQGSDVFATGPLGLISIRRDTQEVLVTRNGIDWKVQTMPAAMVTASSRGPTIAIGDRSVVYLTWSGFYGKGETYVPSLWVGSFEP